MEFPSLRDVIDALNVRARILFGIALIGGVLHFAPTLFGEDSGLAKFQADYRPWIAFVTLASTVLASIKAYDAIEHSLKERRRRFAVLADMESLSESELFRIVQCVESNTRSLIFTDYFFDDRSLVDALITRGILERAGPPTERGDAVCVIPEFVWRYAKARQQALKDRLAELRARREGKPTS